MRVGTALARSAVLAGALGVSISVGPAAAADRAYELVTDGLDRRVYLSAGMTSPATADGNAVCFVAPLVISEQIPDGLCAKRSGGGWATEWVTQPATGFPADDQYGPKVRFVSEDGSRHLFATYRLVVDAPDTEPRIRNGFLRSGGQTTWVTGPLGSPSPTAEGRYADRVPAAASADLSHVLFQTPDQVLPSDTNSDVDVYEWTNGTTRLVSADADGDAVGGTLAGAGEGGGMRSPAIPGTISRNGARVIFQSTAVLAPGAEAGVGNVYMRQGGSVSLVSPRLNAADPPPEAISFVGGAEDGSIVYLSTTEQLTDDPKQPGAAVYRYDVEGNDLSLVATGTNVKALAVSADGSSVFYTATMGLPQLFVNRGSGPVLIGSLFPTDGAFPYHIATASHFQRGIRVTADGSAATFVSQSPALVPGSPTAIPQVYRWRAGEGLARLSTTTTGSDPGPASIGNYATFFPFMGGDRWRGELAAIEDGQGLYGRAMTADAGTVFFDSAQQLVPEDTNGRVDVYEWSAGQLELVSSGDSPADSFYLDNSADGSTVFFLTDEALDPRDKNALRDVYAARVGGGFPPPPASDVGATPPAAGPVAPGPAAAPATSTPSPVVVPPADPITPGPDAGSDADRLKLEIITDDVELEGRRVSVPVRSSASGDVRVILRHRGRRLGAGETQLQADRVGEVDVSVTRSAFRRLPKGEDVSLKIVVRLTADDGRSVRAGGRATVTAPADSPRRSAKRRAAGGTR